MQMEQQKLPLKHLGYSIVCAEVPNEISLAFNISGCIHKCKDCHSKFLWEYKGNYLGQDIKNILPTYKDLITCVCFLGGDQNIPELMELCKYVKDNNLKTCIYSGYNRLDMFYDLINANLLDYLKIGNYDCEKGALNTIGTNQIMYSIKNKELTDITYIFQIKKYISN